MINFPALISRPFIPPWPDLHPFVAEIWLIVAIIAVLLTPFFTRRSNIATAGVAIVGLRCALLSLVAARALASDAGPRFGGMLVSDSVAVAFKAMLLVFVIGIILLWLSVSAGEMHEGDGPEFFTLLLGATLGMMLMASTSNLLMIFMAVEFASLPSYVLAGFRKTHRVGSEASLKYVLFGAATSSIMIYGLSMLYGLYGTLQIETLAARMTAAGAGAPVVLAVSGILIGVGFKIAAVPFHFWCPDVFEGAAIDVSAFLSVASKGAGLVLLLRVLMSFANGMAYHGQALVSIAAIVGMLGVVTATVGNTGAFVQTNIKRLLAYSSIAHAGYMLCALSLIVRPSATPNADLAHAAGQTILLYLAVYLFMNLGAFAVAGLMHRATGSEELADYAGLATRAPILAVTMACFMFSFVGLPPFAGFAAKLQLMIVLANGGGWWWWLVGAIGINTVLSLYYYARVVKVMFLTPGDKPAVFVNPLGLAMSVGCAAMLLIMLLAFNPLLSLAGRYAGLSIPAQPPSNVIVADGK